jgi:hypothetical protein
MFPLCSSTKGSKTLFCKLFLIHLEYQNIFLKIQLKFQILHDLGDLLIYKIQNEKSFFTKFYVAIKLLWI